MKKTSILLSILIVCLVICLGLSLNTNYQLMQREKKSSYILTRFDKTDLQRMNRLIERFKHHQGDNLLVISPSIDSGPEIHEVFSNGSQIKWIIDNTLDGLNTDQGKVMLTCQNINTEESDDSIAVFVSKCSGYKEDQKIVVEKFLKDEMK